MNKIINGKEIANNILEEIKSEIKKRGLKIRLDILQIGNNESSNIYVRNKIKKGEEIGIKIVLHKLDEKVAEKELKNLILELNTNKSVSGFFIQAPIPKHLNLSQLSSLIDTKKDVDGMSPITLGLLMHGNKTAFASATATAVLEVLKHCQEFTIPSNPSLHAVPCAVIPASHPVIPLSHTVIPSPDRSPGQAPAGIQLADETRGVDYELDSRIHGNDSVDTIHKNFTLAGKHAVIIGRSLILGKPLTALLLNHDATVTICHSKTKNLKSICKTADILVSCTGVSNLVTKDFVKEGAIVIDCGSPTQEVDFENVKKVASYITPVPGGVGPLTIACLLRNCILSF